MCCRCSKLPTSKFVIARLGSDGELGERKDVYWFGRNVPTPVRGGLRYQLYIRFAVGVTNGRERDGCPKSLVYVRRTLKTTLFAWGQRGLESL
jgi:hypothetical protein